MQLPDKNVRPVGFLESLHSSPPTWRGILRHFRKIHPAGGAINVQGGLNE
jgi:hypothetical protein